MHGVLMRAMEKKEPVLLIYLDGKNQITQRKVHPFELKGRTLKAYCTLRRQTRLFNLDNILSVFPDKLSMRKSG
jgi:predicted DNA-binding transcriptional regulator YafY